MFGDQMPVSMRAQTAGTQKGAQVAECSRCAMRLTSFCGALPGAALETLALSRNRARFNKRQTIVCEGEPGTLLFNVTSGVVKLIRSSPDGRAQIVGFRVPGEFFASPTEEKYTFTAVAVTDVEICRFTRQQLKRLWSEWPDLLERLFTMSCAQLTSNEEQMFLLGRKTAREKVASFLLTYANRTACDNQDSMRLINLPMTRVEIADFLGLTIETVSRVFSSLVDEGMISVGISRSVRFMDLQALSRAAGD